MFCPRCAAQNLDDAKFCRACGTNLETVALEVAVEASPSFFARTYIASFHWAAHEYSK